jgi:hypothetical protein
VVDAVPLSLAINVNSMAYPVTMIAVIPLHLFAPTGHPGLTQT